ncbi:type II toxin-antitoxin system RelE/ParE family toxin [Parabacteroides sp.]
MEGAKEKQVIASLQFFSSIDQIFEYGKSIFGERKAIEYENLIYENVKQLATRYLLHAEYPYLPTKDKRYRRIVLPAHFIIYRIKSDRIEVLNILHQAVSITQARKSRNIKP